MDACIKYKWKVKMNLEKLILNCEYYFDYIINGTKINFSNILLDKKLYEENISVYNFSYKTPTGLKPLPVRFNKIDGFITAH